MNLQLKPEIMEELDAIVKVIVTTIDTEVIYLFGSFARGEEREDSDFDIFVLLRDDEERTLLCHQWIAHALCESETRELDILASHKSNYYDKTTRTIMGNVVFQEGVRLYGKEN